MLISFCRPKKSRKPLAALLGAFEAQLGYGPASIGGKDSMSGSFNEIHVPPTLVSFAVDTALAGEVLTPEYKKAGHKILSIELPRTAYDLPDYEKVKAIYAAFKKLAGAGSFASAYAVDGYGILAAAVRQALGNHLGVAFEKEIPAKELFENRMGDLLAEISDGCDAAAIIKALEEAGAKTRVVGTVLAEGEGISIGGEKVLSFDEELASWKKPLESVFPTKAYKGTEPLEEKLYDCSKKGEQIYVCKHKVARPTVFIPVFPGTNCEYDSAKAFERAGAEPIVKVFRNANAQDIRESVEEFEKAISQAQMIMFPGGFSAGDEPDGSAKFFATAFRNEKIKEAVEKMLQERDGLALGICNGFQALIKLGLVPGGSIVGQDENSPTLTYNTIGRHISKMAYTKVVSNKSPWLMLAELGKTYTCPASHGEGRFVAPKEWIDKLFANGQVATRYADPEGRISMDEEWNINGSYEAIEGITSPDGRCLGKMAHAERRGDHVAINIVGEQDMKIFESGVKYFS